MSGPDLVLTPEFQRALDLLERGENIFLTGKAGTGKSTLIRHFLATTRRRVVVAAPTGIAALNVGGYTIHRLLSLTATTTVDEVRTGRYRPGRFAKALASLDTLIIDEASMVRADLFDMLTAALERFGPRPGTPLGGVQLVLVGDLHQLPPVVTEGEADFFATRYATPYFFSADSYDQFPTVELTTVFRQLGDDRLTAILNAIREGVLLGHAMDELNARTDREFEPPEHEFWLTLTPTNRLATSRNNARLAHLDTPERISTATQTGDLSTLDPPADATLRFKEGAQVMMLTNDPGDRWVNGTIGRIEHVESGESDDPGDLSVAVVFTDGSAAEVRPFTWEATRPVVESGTLRHEVVGTFTQLPFRLAWAITIHKSQGQTLDRVVVDLTGGTFSDGQVYVALSRCTSMAGLVLRRPVFAKDLKTDRRITRFLRSARPTTAQAQFCGIGMLTVGEEGRMSRPRPVEIAVAFSDGTALSTLVNPQRDLADARLRFAITTADVALAPTLAEAWALLAPVLDGCTPVGPGIDETMALLDFELKRLGVVVPLPLGVAASADGEAPGATGGSGAAGAPGAARTSAHSTDEPRASAPPGKASALDRARAALAALTAPADAVDAFTDPTGSDLESAGVGYLLTRDPDVPAPRPAHLPGLADLLAVSGPVSRALIGGQLPESAPPDPAWSTSVPHALPQTVAPVSDRATERGNTRGGEGVASHQELAAGGPGEAATAGPGVAITGPTVAVARAQVLAAAGRVEATAAVLDRLRRLEPLLGPGLAETVSANAPDAVEVADVLHPEARVCFTGEVLTPSGRPLARGEMEALALAAGLRPVPSVTKTRTDVLVTAEPGTQSGKARKAREYGKAVLDAETFLHWLGDRGVPVPS
ncbi:AAA family ATPase [Ruania alkalisoli]|uniref:AAA family ATPase n=1 Tax=Ruania alkalisoli TaxID=2779775 RepID=UPI001B357A02|nr:AAA family ATPase [Ruania alkalisoli]